MLFLLALDVLIPHIHPDNSAEGPESGLKRNDVTRQIEDHNVQTRLLFSGNLVRHPCFDGIRGTDAYRTAGSLEMTDYIMNNSFWVGVYPGMTNEKLDYMAKVILEAVKA